MTETSRFERLLERVRRLKEKGELDLSMEEDLSIAVMNLLSLEEHFFFTAEKTGKKEEYFQLLDETRAIRRELMERMISRHEGETWCIAKHLLAATMRLIEVATKLKKEGKDDDARRTFDEAYRVYSLFWALRLKLVNLEGVTKIPDGKLNVHDTGETARPWTHEDILKKLVDCCDE